MDWHCNASGFGLTFQSFSVQFRAILCGVIPLSKLFGYLLFQQSRAVKESIGTSMCTTTKSEG